MFARQIALRALLAWSLCLSASALTDEVVAAWEFSDGLLHWAEATPAEMQADISHRGGTLRGYIQDSEPHFDSPPLDIVVDDRHHVVIRMKYTGRAELGKIVARSSAAPPDENYDHSRSSWAPRPQATVYEASSSFHLAGAAVDGDQYSRWTAASSGGEFLMIDLGEPAEIHTLRLTSEIGGGGPAGFVLLYSFLKDGPFREIASHTDVPSTTEPQDFSSFPGTNARFWKVFFTSSADGSTPIMVREIAFLGPAAVFAEVHFRIDERHGHWGTYYIPLGHAFQGRLTQLRIYPAVENYADDDIDGVSVSPSRGESFVVDFIRIAIAPTIRKVRGCLDVYHTTNSQTDNVWHYQQVARIVNGFLRHHTHQYAVGAESYASTYNCPPEGGVRLQIEGTFFGQDKALVLVGGKPCVDVEHESNELGSTQTYLTCSLPRVAYPSRWPDLQPSSRPGDAPLEPDNANAASGLVTVQVANPRLPGLVDSRTYLSYRIAPAVPALPTLSNIAARSVDVSWRPPTPLGRSWWNPQGFQRTNGWDALTTTGYVVAWRDIDSGGEVEAKASGSVFLNPSTGGVLESDMRRQAYFWRAQFGMATGQGIFKDWNTTFVGNVTTTTIRNLTPNTSYIFAVAAVAEDTRDGSWLSIDKYGRREALVGATVSPLSVHSNATRTLEFDLVFEFFSARSTLNASAADSRTTLGPTGQFGGEGHYGLYIMGNANLENCNTSLACCDGFDDVIARENGLSQACSVGSVACYEPRNTHGNSHVDDSHLRPTPSNVASMDRTNSEYDSWATAASAGKNSSSAQSGGIGAEKIFGVVGEDYVAATPEARCGSRLRLTPSAPRLSGAVWYPRNVDVREGFDTVFAFEISQPSLRCGFMDDVYTRCRSRGGDGLAFVVQQYSPTALGDVGMGLGYAGIANSIAVEFDTFYNEELAEPYENHISVHTAGWREPNSANQLESLGASVRIPDLASGPHVARIRYSPKVDVLTDILGAGGSRGGGLTDVMPSTLRAARFLTNAEHVAGGQADWATGVGVLQIFLDDLSSPILTVPLNIDGTLNLDHGRAWVGFTAATGEDTYQTQDLLNWHFTSLRQEIPHYPSPVINGIGAHACVNSETCLHK